MRDRRLPVVRFCEGSCSDPLEPGKPGTLDKSGSANRLTRDAPTSKLGQACAAHAAVVQVEKFAGPLPAATTFDPPKA